LTNTKHHLYEIRNVVKYLISNPLQLQGQHNDKQVFRLYCIANYFLYRGSEFHSNNRAKVAHLVQHHLV